MFLCFQHHVVIITIVFDIITRNDCHRRLHPASFVVIAVVSTSWGGRERERERDFTGFGQPN